MTSALNNRAVLFADLVGSTRLYDELGDRRGHAVTAGCLRGITETVERFGGVVVKTIGDAVMATFLSADAAFSCAEAIVSGVRCTALGSDKPLGVRIGFHYGPVLEEDGDVFGDTVNVAARMAELAENQRIFTTGATIVELDATLCARMRRVDCVAIKGRKQRVDVFELTTGSETLVRLATAPPTEIDAGDGPSLTISCRGKRHVLRGERSSLSIGRDRSNDLVLASPSASRFHARIEWRKRAFYIIDRSTNGTVIVREGGRAKTLRRERLRIHGSGTFGIGGSPDDDIEEPIRFEFHAAKRPRSKTTSN